jgi:hypothetical protein
MRMYGNRGKEKAAGYYTPEPQEDPDNPVGRPLEKY